MNEARKYLEDRGYTVDPSVETRNEFLKREFPEMKRTKIPGLYTTDRGLLCVSGWQVRLAVDGTLAESAR